MYDFLLCNLDTDSISVCKRDGSPFSKDEQTRILAELNSIMPEKISWEDDGYYSKVIIVKAKNYILRTQDGKIKIKGSSLKATGKEVALQCFIKDVIHCFLDDRVSEIPSIYNKYVIEIFNITDITRWCSKKTITEKVVDAKRTNEQKVLDAIKGTEYGVGDKIYTYFQQETNAVKLKEHWDNDHDKEKLLEKLFKTVQTFKNVLDVSLFTNYALKSHPIKCQLADVLGLPHPEKTKRGKKVANT